MGANIGDWARMARTYCKDAEVHCFELSATTFAALRTNLPDPHFTVNNIGLSSRSGPITYKDYGPGSGSNTILDSATFWDEQTPPNLVTAQLETGDAYCAKHAIHEIDFVKIDVEGAEYDAVSYTHLTLPTKRIV